MLMTVASSRGTENMMPFLVGQKPAIATAAPSREQAERTLVEGLQRGDDASYDVLVRQYGGAMLAVARRLLRHEEDAREAIQDAFIQAFRAMPQFRAEARLSTWLHRITVNACLMRLRGTSRRPEVAIEDLLPGFDDDGDHVQPIQPLPVSVETALTNAETRAQVRACIAQLPEQHRAVIMMRDIEDLSTAEAAEMLGISENAVKIRLHRARLALRTLLVRELGDC